MRRRGRDRGGFLLGTVAIAALWILALGAASAQAEFGIVNFDGETTANEAGDPATQAGSHPFATTTEMQFTVNEEGSTPIPEGNFRTLKVELPAGLTGNPNAVPKCTLAEFAGGLGLSTPQCANSTAIGWTVLEAPLFGPEGIKAPVYNLVPGPNEPARFGFKILTASVFLDASIRTGGDYGTTITIADSSQGLPVTGTALTLWGVPSDPAHDTERGKCMGFSGPTGESCPTEAPPRPFLSMPTACSGPLTTTLHANSWQEPEFKTASFLSHDSTDTPVGIEGCERLPFSPSITTRLGTTEADSPTSLAVDLHVPQNNEDPEGFVSSHVKTSVVTLPGALSINPAVASGLGACSMAQFGLDNANPVTCPDSSKVGSAEIDSPLLATPLRGPIYLAEQGSNPFGSELAIYVATSAEGVTIKLAGRVEPEPSTGQLTTTFDNNPQLPFSDFRLNFFGGAQAVLRTPSLCGTYDSRATITPWDGNPPTPASDSQMMIDRGPGGAACPSGALSVERFSAGTTNPLAGRYSPFVMGVSRPDGSQLLTGLSLTLPKGLLGKIAGIPYCPEASIAAAVARSGEGQGAVELAAPSCPAASRVGSVAVTTGAGPHPFYLGTATAYLAGPYRGAPLSLVIDTPVVAGPLDLGVVVVRAALNIALETTQLTAVTDPLPTLVHGIPIDIRGLFLNLDRDRFTLNPTNCTATSVTGSLIGSDEAMAPLSDRFQVGGCGDLGFKPKLTTKLSGKANRGAHPKLKATVKVQNGNANIRRAVVTLPKSEILDQGHIGTSCTRVQFAVQACPAASRYGFARAKTPLLDKPLEGPVYLRASNHKLPDLVADLRGQIRIALDGKIESAKGALRATFQAVPDAPVTSFVLSMQGGKKGLLQNTTNICRGVHRTNAKFTAQNGRKVSLQPKLTTGGC
jgi:hypothetical protein